MIVESNVADFKEKRFATIGLSRGANENGEMVESIGEQQTTDELKNLAVSERGFDRRIYRVINPFSADSFEPGAAYKIVQFFCFKIHRLIRPKTYLFRSLLGFDKYEIILRLPNYNFVSAERRKEFQTLLRKMTNRFRIES